MRIAQVIVPHAAVVVRAHTIPRRVGVPPGTTSHDASYSFISIYARMTPAPLKSALTTSAATGVMARVRTGTAIAFEALCTPVTKIAAQNAATHSRYSRVGTS